MTRRQSILLSLIALTGLFASSGNGCEEDDGPPPKQHVVGGVLYTSYYDEDGKLERFTSKGINQPKSRLGVSLYAARAVGADDWSTDSGPAVPSPGLGTNSAAASLAGGQVLFAGGYAPGEDFPTAQAFLYDDAAATIHALPDMVNARRDHHMTRLTDNTVLITGGVSGEIPNEVSLASAERFDPVSRTFNAVGSMNVARGHHAAALLPDGRVLIVGGDPFDSNPNRVPTAELFDPATETFTVSAGLPGDDWEHAITLKNGKVLLTCAHGTKNAALYDPTLDAFIPTGSMSSEHWNSATATLLDDGRVLIAGGWAEDANLNINRIAATDLYDPDTGLFTAGPMMNDSRYGHIAFRTPDGNVLIAGGQSNAGVNLDRFEVFDPDSNTFTLQNARMSSGFAFGSGAGVLP